jgi:hypothetical protein
MKQKKVPVLRDIQYGCMVLIFYPFTQIFIISHKGTIFSQNKILFQSAFLFSGTKM